jgi:predicted transcriptional regulator with HTH domain
MPHISQQKKDKIQEQILHHLFEISPESTFTSKIAETIARDEEFTKQLLQELKAKNLINEVNKNPSGALYARRQRWALSAKAFKIYSKHQNNV